MGPIYRFLADPLFGLLHVPQINKLPSRMAIYPLLLFSWYAVMGWQMCRYREKPSHLFAWLQAALIVLVVAAGLEHATKWNIGWVERTVIPVEDTAWYRFYSPSLEATLLDVSVSLTYRLSMYVSIACTVTYFMVVCWWLMTRPVWAGKVR